MFTVIVVGLARMVLVGALSATVNVSFGSPVVSLLSGMVMVCRVGCPSSKISVPVSDAKSTLPCALPSTVAYLTDTGRSSRTVSRNLYLNVRCSGALVDRHGAGGELYRLVVAVADVGIIDNNAIIFRVARNRVASDNFVADIAVHQCVVDTLDRHGLVVTSIGGRKGQCGWCSDGTFGCVVACEGDRDIAGGQGRQLKLERRGATRFGGCQIWQLRDDHACGVIIVVGDAHIRSVQTVICGVATRRGCGDDAVCNVPIGDGIIDTLAVTVCRFIQFDGVNFSDIYRRNRTFGWG